MPKAFCCVMKSDMLPKKCLAEKSSFNIPNFFCEVLNKKMHKPSVRAFKIFLFDH